MLLRFNRFVVATVALTLVVLALFKRAPPLILWHIVTRIRALDTLATGRATAITFQLPCCREKKSVKRSNTFLKKTSNHKALTPTEITRNGDLL